MKLVLVGQPYDLIFPPSQNSIGLIVYHTALELAKKGSITIYGKKRRDVLTSNSLPFEFRGIAVWRDRVMRKAIRTFPRLSRLLHLDGKLDEHRQYQTEVQRRLSRDRPDIVHVMNYWEWCRKLKAPGTSHRLILEMQCEWLSQRKRGKVAEQLKVVDGVVAVSDHIANTFRAAFPDYPGVVATVGNGVDVTRFKPPEGTRSLTNATRKILFVGRISPEKGVHTLLESFRHVAQQFDDVELVIAGPQAPLPPDFIASLSSDSNVIDLLRFYDRYGRCTYRQHLESLLARQGIQNRVRFLGGLPHEELIATYQASSVVVNPSLSESFGISVVEAMACGIPVIGTRVGGMCESILDGTTGLLVKADAPEELAGALIRVLGDPVRAQGMGAEGRKRAVQLYSWAARAERLMDVYLRVA